MDKAIFNHYLERLCSSVMRMNEQAKGKDLLRNQVNYGVASTYATILNEMGHTVDICVYGEDDYLISAKVVVNGEIKINFQK